MKEAHIDKDIDIAGVLKKPYRRRKESLYDSVDRILNQRHNLIHRNEMSLDYLSENVNTDLENIRAAIQRIYDRLLDRYGWQPGAPW